MSVWNAISVARPFSGISVSKGAALAVAGTIAFAAATLFLLDLGNDLLVRVYWAPSSWRIYAPVVVALIAALAFANTRYQDFTSLLKACTRASAVGLLVLLVIEAPDYSLANADAKLAFDYVGLVYPAALALAIASVFRPSFIVPVVIYVISTRELVYPISGLPMSFLDIRYMVDMALYLAIFGIAVVKIGPRIHPWLASEKRQFEIVGVAMGLHLANYFWSGIAKLAAGPTPWYWIFENHTYNQIPYTIESGILPIGHMPWLSQFAYDVFGIANVPLNGIIVLVQLFAVVCVLKVSWLKITSVLFDMLHIGIFVLGGLFFWPWIWNNLTIWWAARSQKQGLTLNTKVACISAIALGFPFLNMNSAAWLAWFDVADARQIYFEAVTRNGETVKVPSAFFVSHSYSVSHGYMGHQALEGQYDGTQLASTDSVERNELSGACASPSRFAHEQPFETPEKTAERKAALGRFLSFHHHKMMDREASVGRGSWYFHAHHHPSNPFLYEGFNSLSLKDVVGYNLVMESGCFSLKEGKVQKKVLARATEFYDVR